MMKYNPDNVRIKRKYFTFMKEAKRQDEASIDAIAKALNRFEVYGIVKPLTISKLLGSKSILPSNLISKQASH